MRAAAFLAAGNRGTAYGVKCLLCLVALLLFCRAAAEDGAGALLERAEVRPMIELSSELAGMDVPATVERLLSGESVIGEDFARRAVEALKSRVREALLSLIRETLPVALLCGTLRFLFSGKSAGPGGVRLFARTAFAVALTGRFVAAKRTALQVMELGARLSGAISPALTAALTLTGAARSASALSPAAALCAGAIEDVLPRYGLAACSLTAVVAVAGNLSERFRLKRLFGLLRSGMRWAVGVMTAAFMGILGTQGLLGGGLDSAAARTARYAIENMVPVIGGELSDTLHSLSGSAVAVRNALGVTGMLALLTACAEPLGRLTADVISVKLLTALSEPAADESLTAMLGQMGEALEMLLAASIAAAALALLLIGGFLMAAGNAA